MITQASQIKSHEAEQHKAIIAEKEADIKKLHLKLEEQQALLRQLSSLLQEEKEREVASRAEELQARLMEAQLVKSKAEGELATAQMLKESEEEFRQLEKAAQKKVC